MIAVALIPPAATVGIAVAYGEEALAVGSGVLVAVNVLSINLAALVVLWYSGYRPERFFRQEEARVATLKRVAVLLAAIALLSVFLGGVTYDSYRAAQTESDIREAVGAELADSAYDGYGVVELDVETTTERVLFQRPTEVSVTVGVPPGADPPGLASALEARLGTERGIDVDVRVLYVEVERSGRG
jgi:uncharacterized membrane protein